MKTAGNGIRAVYTEREVAFKDLRPDYAEIFLTMGSSAYVPDKAMVSAVEEAMEKVSRLCRPKYGYIIVSVGETAKGEITAGGVRMYPGRAIARFLGGAAYFGVFVATAGNEFNDWMQAEAASGDILREFIASGIGSEIAEATARVMAADIGAIAEGAGMGHGNIYGPGYCGWNVDGQHKLFSLLPSRPCGIVLKDSGLMVPVKSVSGMIPIGENIKKMPYGCAICNKKDCYKNRAK